MHRGRWTFQAFISLIYFVSRKINVFRIQITSCLHARMESTSPLWRVYWFAWAIPSLAFSIVCWTWRRTLAVGAIIGLGRFFMVLPPSRLSTHSSRDFINWWVSSVNSAYFNLHKKNWWRSNSWENARSTPFHTRGSSFSFVAVVTV